VLGFVRDPDRSSVSPNRHCVLLFIVGLELQPSALWRLRNDISARPGQVMLCGVALSVLLYLTLGLSPEASLAIGLRWRCRRPRRCCRCLIARMIES